MSSLITQNKATTAQLEPFRQMLCETFEVPPGGALPINKVEHVFNIFKDSEDFSFNDEDERLSNLLILTACLYSVKKKEKICFISPTYYYAQQAAIMRSQYLKGLDDKSNETLFPVVVPGMVGYNESVNASKIVFMHGTDFSKHLPAGWIGRKIIQIFPGIDVPVDPLRRSVCHYGD